MAVHPTRWQSIAQVSHPIGGGVTNLMLHEQGRSVSSPAVHSNVHTMEADWPSDRMNEGPTAC